MVDSYWWGKVERISPEAPVPVCSVKKKENRLGGAANVALNVAAMGAKPIICSVVGDDMEGRILKGLFQEQNINTDGLLFSTERCTTVKTRVLGNKSQMLRIDEETELPLSDNEQAAFLQRIEKIIESNKSVQTQLKGVERGLKGRYRNAERRSVVSSGTYTSPKAGNRKSVHYIERVRSVHC